MSSQAYVTLNNGVQMPLVGLGTFMLEPDDAEAAVVSALQDGYRLIDTANAYMNEKAVGRGIKRSGVAREDIFLESGSPASPVVLTVSFSDKATTGYAGECKNL